MERSTNQGESPVISLVFCCAQLAVLESCSLELECQEGGKLHLTLKSSSSLIENKYLEGRMKSTLERELTAREVAESRSGCFLEGY